MTGYVGRFAPSPTGPLHAGSLVAALASWLDARVHGGRWLVRIEDADRPRCVPGADRLILSQLAACGLVPDEPPIRQSQRGARYREALDALLAAQRAYPCGCSRRDIVAALANAGRSRARGGELVYPGTCRGGLHGKAARAWRFLVQNSEPDVAAAGSHSAQCATFPVANDKHGELEWFDRRLRQQRQNVAREVGDFVLLRADGLWAYQLAVVVDDADQRVTDVVRGEDLADNTPRQILLQRALEVPTPRYLHTPLVLGPNGEKLSKQNGAHAIDTGTPGAAQAALAAAASVLGLPPHGGPTAAALAAWVPAWRALYNPRSR
ncbi:MAG: Glutamyl-Q tRNA(Asp) synthetase [Burkholderiaceae bacterium]|jgi:glutamyl-Q tRNA(Asp) synthetase|nr:MAG: Glutamyl-Q tRNA(Asp) synthetase [Burkholderiaceae bacterium]